MVRKKKEKTDNSNNKFFEVLKNVYEEKEDKWEELKDHYSPYSVLLMAGNNEKDIHLVQTCNELPNLSARHQYLFLMNVLPKRRRFNKYPKRDDDMTIIVKELSFYYGVSDEKARSMIEVHTPDQLLKIHDYYAVNTDG